MGGIIKNLDITMETYACVLWKATNNQVELWALWKGIEILAQSEHPQVLIFGNSIITIKQAIKIGNHTPFLLSTLWLRIKRKLDRMGSVRFYHIL